MPLKVPTVRMLSTLPDKVPFNLKVLRHWDFDFPIAKFILTFGKLDVSIMRVNCHSLLIFRMISCPSITRFVVKAIRRNASKFSLITVFALTKT